MVKLICITKGNISYECSLTEGLKTQTVTDFDSSDNQTYYPFIVLLHLPNNRRFQLQR